MQEYQSGELVGTLASEVHVIAGHMVSSAQVLRGCMVSGAQVLRGRMVAPTIIDRDHYTGAYTVIPSAEAQVLHTSELAMDHDVVIRPIPNNYGLITYNGMSITVS